MNKSKTIETLEKYYHILETAIHNDNISDNDKFFVFNIELELAKSIIQEFDEKSSKKLGQILAIMTE